MPPSNAIDLSYLPPKIPGRSHDQRQTIDSHHHHAQSAKSHLVGYIPLRRISAPQQIPWQFVWMWSRFDKDVLSCETLVGLSVDFCLLLREAGCRQSWLLQLRGGISRWMVWRMKIKEPLVVVSKCNWKRIKVEEELANSHNPHLTGNQTSDIYWSSADGSLKLSAQPESTAS